MITKEEWNRRAEFAAASKFGEDHAGWYTFKRYMAGPVGVATAAGALGLGAYWLVSHVHLPHATAGHFPLAFWVALTLLAIATVVAFRPGRFLPAAAILLRGVAFTFLWLGLAVYALTVAL